jgi:flagellar biosynthesis/type III secretory pathway protein FliH
MKANTMETDHYFEFRSVLEAMGEALEEVYRLGYSDAEELGDERASSEYQRGRDIGFELGYQRGRESIINAASNHRA